MPETRPKLKVLDLFSGIPVGGFSLGLERTGGFETVAFCEIDPFCRRVLTKHWPAVPHHDDVTTREHYEGEADVITAGFPCQDISSLGKRAGLAGARSGLFREVVRAICVVRPLFAILENVADLLHRGMGDVLGELASSGNDIEWDCIPAQAVGAPHGRDRIWIVAYPHGRRRWTDAPGRDHSYGEDARREKANRLPGAIFEQRHSGKVAAPSDADRERRLQPGWCFSEVRRRFDHGAPASSGWATPWPEELSQIQGMDDGLPDRLDKAGIDALGNAVVPQIPEIIGRAILAAHLHSSRAA